MKTIGNLFFILYKYYRKVQTKIACSSGNIFFFRLLSFMGDPRKQAALFLMNADKHSLVHDDEFHYL